MSTEKQSFTIRISASRLGKGLLAIPQRFKDWFPRQKGPIQVFFDNEEKASAVTFHPHDPAVKENRVFGLGRWFSKRGVREGDLISITLEDQKDRKYRIALDRFIREQQETESRNRLRAAQNDSEAERELSIISRMVRKRPRDTARAELLRLALETPRQPRPRYTPSLSERHEGVPAGIRVLLREVHGGRCQLCAFTFEKRNGDTYFELHHLDADVGHHPNNLLVLCANCHAQFEQARVGDYEWLGGWLVAVKINGKRVAVRQPFAHDSLRKTLLLICVITAAQIARVMIR